MSLRLLLPDDAAETLTAGWPSEPAVYDLPEASPLLRIINGRKLTDFLTTGCVPADLVNVIHQAALRHPNSFTSRGRLDPLKISHWMAEGSTVQARKIDLWYPPMATIMGALRQETGCDGYVTGFITPGGGQGLDYHWDQTTAIIVQLEGVKTWEIWHPVVDDPVEHHLDSINYEGLPGLIEQLRERGPDQVVEMGAGKVLVLPRGWIHNPHSLNQTERSVHITFVLQERTPSWIARKLAASAIADPQFRAAIAPDRVVGDGLTEEVDHTRHLLMDYLSEVNPEDFAKDLRGVALSERTFAAS